jgi:sirohydrochlorin cobaltochelatase
MQDGSSSCYLLVMHGAPPSDFPREDLREYFQLHSMAESSPGALPAGATERLEALEARMRAWPRTSANDPFHAASLELADALHAQSGRPVVVGFNEFCDPGVEAAVEAAIETGATQVVVLTAMLTRGGEHAEVDIPQALDRARQRHPAVQIEYAWPIPVEATARFLLGAAADVLGAGRPNHPARNP